MHSEAQSVDWAFFMDIDFDASNFIFECSL